MNQDDKAKFVLETLYEELRQYREKEFHTFIFAFPIISAGFIPEFHQIRSLLILLSVFGGLMIHYIYRNHWRMMRMKDRIVSLQGELGLNQYFGELRPEEWRKKNFRAHLGMMTYIIILSSQLVVLWKDIILEALAKAAK